MTPALAHADAAGDIRSRLRRQPGQSAGPAMLDGGDEPVVLAWPQAEFQRRLCRVLADELPFSTYGVDAWDDPADVETAAGDIGTMRRVGSNVFKPAEAARLMNLVPEAHQLGVRVEIGPGDEPDLLRLDFLFA